MSITSCNVLVSHTWTKWQLDNTVLVNDIEPRPGATSSDNFLQLIPLTNKPLQPTPGRRVSLTPNAENSQTGRNKLLYLGRTRPDVLVPPNNDVAITRPLGVARIERRLPPADAPARRWRRSHLEIRRPWQAQR